MEGNKVSCHSVRTFNSKISHLLRVTVIHKFQVKKNQDLAGCNGTCL